MATEAELLDAVGSLVAETDADIIVGYEVQKKSIGTTYFYAD